MRKYRCQIFVSCQKFIVGRRNDIHASGEYVLQWWYREMAVWWTQTCTSKLCWAQWTYSNHLPPVRTSATADIWHRYLPGRNKRKTPSSDLSLCSKLGTRWSPDNSRNISKFCQTAGAYSDTSTITAPFLLVSHSLWISASSGQSTQKK